MMAWWCRKFVVQKRPCPHWASFRLPPKGCYPQDKPSSWKKLPENLVQYRCSVKHHFCMIVKSAKSFALHHFKHGSKTSQNITDPLPNVGVATGTKHTTKTPLPCNLLWSLFRWALAEKKRDKQKKRICRYRYICDRTNHMNTYENYIIYISYRIIHAKIALDPFWMTQGSDQSHRSDVKILCRFGMCLKENRTVIFPEDLGIPGIHMDSYHQIVSTRFTGFTSGFYKIH